VGANGLLMNSMNFPSLDDPDASSFAHDVRRADSRNDQKRDSASD
jgi:hypothetical protein